MQQTPRSCTPAGTLQRRRSGAATVDYVLGLGVILPLLVVVLPIGRRMMQSAFELACTVVAWPFM
jgi:hypothetical protein